MSFWKGRVVAVTGWNGFVGSHLWPMLEEAGATVVKPRVNLLDFHASKYAFYGVDTVFNLAAKVGGIEFASSNHQAMFGRNVVISTNALQAAWEMGVEKFVVISSACIYPDVDYGRLSENVEGTPTTASLGYGLAKKVAELQGSLYANLGMDVKIARPFNIYGPGDKMDPAKAHVIPAILGKLRAKGPLELRGSGDEVRNFTYVEDSCRALMLLAESGPTGKPINIAGDEGGVTIGELARKIMEIAGEERRLTFKGGDGGHRVRIPDLSWLKSQGFTPEVSLTEGLRRTIEWWRGCD